ncbi:NAD(P)/FAD-dependent oxidoreductase [Rhodoplanes sp. Z2-YC6860]|uniref:NAD(P)/FAD-dependent oxidoreductase n=1 Tax=Rhodoplanes sp. Z2-YC6860 TaxID=674703 RepID=UPI00078C01D8|nr:NAD(P)/FAD-dependent oxidoreductase [Rhodoplanes sp. Z2-YC6860]AMN40824.1 amine oxidase [Rhodoplanes sp. Z2-YC6860]
MTERHPRRLKIAVVGTGISGLSAAWLLHRAHDITVFERDGRIGGHSNTVDVTTPTETIAVDTGFIVYNEPAYPNLTAMFRHLGVATERSNMSFAVSLDWGRLEYAGTDLAGLFAQKRNLVSPRFWSMLSDLRKFYRQAPRDLVLLNDSQATLGEYLNSRGYGEAFRDDHLLPMAAAIWSASPETMMQYPAASFIRFYDNHGLLQISDCPEWRTVSGGSRNYVRRLSAPFAERIKHGVGVAAIWRSEHAVEIRDSAGRAERFDHAVVALHADDALALLHEPSPEERELLGAFAYSDNTAVLHSDPSLMPGRKAAWSSWNYIGPARSDDEKSSCTVTYWMNRLQNLGTDQSLFVTLNPYRPPAPQHVLRLERYQHPIFGVAALAAQKRLWSIQGQRNTWFCGSYFGSGFHEDGLQSGLAVAEALGGVRRPWEVEDESGRIFLCKRAAVPGATPTDRAA